jgi:hypothetical protein
MAANCPKCGGSSYEAELTPVRNLNVSVVIIKCSLCNTAIGVFDVATFDRVKDIAKFLKLN